MALTLAPTAGEAGSQPSRLGVVPAKDFLDASHLPAHETDLDPVGMGGGAGEYILDDTPRQFARGLILLEDDQDLRAGLKIGATPTVHDSIKGRSGEKWGGEAAAGAGLPWL